MTWHLPCDCGAKLAVTAAMAGSTTNCRCGRAVAVPSLSQLRRTSGDAPYATNALDAIQLAFDSGTLPGNSCVECGLPSSDLVSCDVNCERSFRKRSLVNEGQEDSLAFYLAGIVIPLLTLVSLARDARNTRLHTEQFGRDTDVAVSFCLCHRCRASVGRLNGRRLRRLATRVTEYQRLFEEYPRARIRLAVN